MRYIDDGSIFDLYGQWNALVAENRDGDILGWTFAHDGDFFPESIMDYVETLRKSNFFMNPHDYQLIQQLRVDLDITQICNSDCIFCFSRSYQKREYKNQWTNIEILEKVISDLGSQGTKTVRFCGGGEPFMHPEIKELLPLPYKYGLRSCVISNLDIIDDDISYLICKYIDQLRWSVNASSDVTRLKLHRPRGQVNLLSKTLEYIRNIIKYRNLSSSKEKKPLICATFLILPDNMNEIISAANLFKEVGIDSLSFRPVYHGLTKVWAEEQLQELDIILHNVRKLSTPHFLIFTPKRNILESPNIDPNKHFSYCISRKVRTLLEATKEGLAFQSCGVYRGTGIKSSLVITNKNRFKNVWETAYKSELFLNAPRDCKYCIDVSMNQTLNFIFNILKKNPDANFSQVLVD